MNNLTHKNVSVIIPCFNAQKYVAEAINSVIDDSFELIAVDDGSTDHTLRELRKYEQRIRIIEGENQGACVARNTGLSVVSGVAVMFLDADDWLLPETLSHMVNVLDQFKADMVIAPVLFAPEDGSCSLRRAPCIEDGKEFIVDWLDGCYVPPCGILWRTEFVRSIGGWDEALQKNQDGDLVLRAVQSGANIVKSAGGGAVYRDHTGLDRISNTHSEEKIRDSFFVLKSAHGRETALGLPINMGLDSAFSRATHGLERLAIRQKYVNLEADIRLYRLANSWPRAEGGMFHISLTLLLGLSLKECLSGWFRTLIRRFYAIKSNIL